MSIRRAASLLAFAFCALAPCASAQTNYNFDESKVGPYQLPDPLTMIDGQKVRDAATWNSWRRPEILHLFETYQFGRTPPPPYAVHFETLSNDQSTSQSDALHGAAIRKQIVIHFSTAATGPKATMLLYLPAAHAGRVPVFLGLNFDGNHSVAADPGIRLGEIWSRLKGTTRYVKQTAAESTRGSDADAWQVEKLLAAGYALATIYYGDIEPDFNGGMKYGVRPLFFRPGQTEPAPDDWGALGAWAWGLSRAADYLQTDPDIDPQRIALIGHSRLGKAALWAGAQDTRFSVVISNESGEGGASLSRRSYGEDIRHLNNSFPHWFCANYHLYTDHEPQLPVDSHMLLALIAPRPLYVASAEEDRGSDPRGEFLAAVAASPVWTLFGKQGIGTDQMPALHQPIGDAVVYHIRAGKHDVTAYDWDQYLKFASQHFRELP
jgi:hypothetical protein